MPEKASERRKAYRRGHMSEWLAALYLMTKGYRILARRYRTKAGEIDLVARRGALVIFVEVKARTGLLAAADAVSATAARRISAAGDIWLSRQADSGQLSTRVDLIAIMPWRWPVHIENVG
jgi:putative endonuclease